MKHEEFQYLDLLSEIINNGSSSANRTKVGSSKVFGRTMRFSLLNETLPLFTTKQVYFKGVVHELLWFMRGETNCKYLQDNGVHIWDLDAKRFAERCVNASTEYNDKLLRGVPAYNIWQNKYTKQTDFNKFEMKEEGELGPIYGHQWRNYNSQGIDQLTEAIEKLQNKRNDRRIIVNSWNPAQTHEMSLPACHVLFQFGVEDDKYLTCALYQRSCDMFLGVPFNVASYSLLTHLLAKATGLEAKEFVWFGFDCHIYDSHRKQAIQQMVRDPFEFPKVKIDKKIENCGTKLLEDGFLNYQDICLEDYKSHDKIKAELADY